MVMVVIWCLAFQRCLGFWILDRVSIDGVEIYPREELQHLLDRLVE